MSMARVGRRRRIGAWCLAGAWGICCAAAHAADDEAALNLEAPAVASDSSAAGRGTGEVRLYLEAAAGRLQRRAGLQDAGSSRLSLDYNLSFRISPDWRFVLSDRLDHIEPMDAGRAATVNSLREVHASWQRPGAGTAFDIGRLNLRKGPSYGFNPTDYFRDGALRVVTTADPMALRENRLGTVMLRAQQLWSGGGLDVALAPKLAEGASVDGSSPDWGATNHSKRALVSVSGHWAETIGYQALLFAEQGRKPQIGFNATALLTDAVVAHAEMSRGQDADRLAAATGLPAVQAGRNRVAAGLTYTTAFNLALTLEYAYNGAAPKRAEWDGVATTQGPKALGDYLLDAQRRQDCASRTAGMVYLTQKDFGVKNLDLSAFLRVNGEDHSRLGWAELRYHWDRLDLALQWFGARGNTLSEYGVTPDRQQFQLIGTWRF